MNFQENVNTVLQFQIYCKCVFVIVCRVFIPSYVSSVKVQLANCSTHPRDQQTRGQTGDTRGPRDRDNTGDSCSVVLKIRARAPPVHNSSALDCREWSPCELDTPLPAWEHWYYILVERYLSNQDVYFRIGVQVTGRQ